MTQRTTLTWPPAAQELGFDHNAVRRLLPHRPPLLLVDRIEAYAPDARRLVGIKNVSQNDPFIQGHFPTFPIFPGVLTVESLLHAATALMHLDSFYQLGDAETMVAQLNAFDPPHTVLAESRIKHISPTFPGDQLRLEAQITGTSERLVHFKVRAVNANGETASQGRLSIAPSAAELSA